MEWAGYPILRHWQLYPDEWPNFQQAIDVVQDNPWYGFSHDLGIVSSTKYKNISYVAAKELLIKVNGKMSVRAYAGWTARAKYQSVVDMMIAEYENAKQQNAVNNTPMPEYPDVEAVTTLRSLILQWNHVYI